MFHINLKKVTSLHVTADSVAMHMWLLTLLPTMSMTPVYVPKQYCNINNVHMLTWWKLDMHKGSWLYMYELNYIHFTCQELFSVCMAMHHIMNYSMHDTITYVLWYIVSPFFTQENNWLAAYIHGAEHIVLVAIFVEVVVALASYICAYQYMKLASCTVCIF